MGNNPLVQFVLQPILIFGVIFHFLMGFVLELKNRSARAQNYAQNKGSANSSWISRNMIMSGLTILAFMLLHFYDFWVPEITIKFIDGDMSGLIDPNNSESGFRYLEHLQHKFVDMWRVALYVISFVFLALHLLHGFDSAFQSVGANNKYTKGLKRFSKIYAIGIPVGFIFIALYHHLKHIL